MTLCYFGSGIAIGIAKYKMMVPGRIIHPAFYSSMPSQPVRHLTAKTWCQPVIQRQVINPFYPHSQGRFLATGRMEGKKRRFPGTAVSA